MMHYRLYHEISSLAIRDSGLAGSEGGRKKGKFSVIFLRNLIEQKGKTDFPAKFMWREGANDRFDPLLELVMI